MRNHSFENDFDLHGNETACRTHFRGQDFALRLFLKQRHKRTRKWPIKAHMILLLELLLYYPITLSAYNFNLCKDTQK